MKNQKAKLNKKTIGQAITVTGSVLIALKIQQMLNEFTCNTKENPHPKE
jgi:hypothetical protein